MSREVSELLKKALALPVEARAALASSLVKSLDGTFVMGLFIESKRGSLSNRGMPLELERDPDREFE
ncbi:MAG TPA: hypothetical protein VII95_10420 [Terriglobales bacterium]|jgi:hypothetical protein